jgi:hypothetical protein
LHRALRDIEQREDSHIADECVHQEPLQIAHSLFIARRLYMQLSKLGIFQGFQRDGYKTVQRLPYGHQ